MTVRRCGSIHHARGSTGQYARGVAKREEILTAALRIVARSGYGRTTVEEPADEVGPSRPGLQTQWVYDPGIGTTALVRTFPGLLGIDGEPTGTG